MKKVDAVIMWLKKAYDKAFPVFNKFLAGLSSFFKNIFIFALSVFCELHRIALPRIGGKAYEAMFAYRAIEDISLMMMPIRSSDRKDFKIEIVNGNEQSEEKLLQILSEDSYRKSLTDTVSDFYQQIVRDMFVWGEISFEVKRDEETNEIKLRRIYHDVYNFGLFSFSYVHLKSRKIAKMRGVNTFSQILSKKSVTFLRIPKSIFTRRQHRRWLKKLKKFSEASPKFFLKDLESSNDNGFDFSTYNRARMVGMLKEQKRLGSIDMTLYSRDTLEFYDMYQFIRFHRFMAILRQELTAQLNQILNVIGVKGEIVISGLPTIEEISDIEKKLLEGKIDFKDIHEQLKY